MAENLDSATGSLSDYTRKLEIATYYSDGDEERAKQIIAGTLKDFYVIKGRFSSTTSFGAFIAFANVHFLNLNSVYPIISNAFELKDIKTFIDWTTFENDIMDFLNTNEHDDVLTRQFKTVFTSSFTLQFASDLKKLVSEKRDIDINRMFMHMVQNRMGLQNVNMIVDVEEISSVDMELHSLTSAKIMEHAAGGRGQADPDIEVNAEEDDREVLKGKDVRLLLRGNLVLSPLNGREIGLLIVGDRLKINIADRHERAVNVLKAFNAFDEDGARPITGRIVYLKRRGDGGYTIYAVVAKGIYVKIEELESGIKVAIDTSYMDSKPEPVGMSRQTIAVLGGLGFVFVALIALLLYFFIK